MEEEKKGRKNHDVVVKGGESLNNAKERITNCIERIVKECFDKKNVLIISHGTVIDLFCCQFSNREAEIGDIKNSNHLDYAIINYENEEFCIVKDIVKI